MVSMVGWLFGGGAVPRNMIRTERSELAGSRGVQPQLDQGTRCDFESSAQSPPFAHVDCTDALRHSRITPVAARPRTPAFHLGAGDLVREEGRTSPRARARAGDARQQCLRSTPTSGGGRHRFRSPRLRCRGSASSPARPPDPLAPRGWSPAPRGDRQVATADRGLPRAREGPRGRRGAEPRFHCRPWPARRMWRLALCILWAKS
jgi:hypothetical protein